MISLDKPGFEHTYTQLSEGCREYRSEAKHMVADVWLKPLELISGIFKNSLLLRLPQDAHPAAPYPRFSSLGDESRSSSLAGTHVQLGTRHAHVGTRKAEHARQRVGTTWL
jgi:hypothetical protein